VSDRLQTPDRSELARHEALAEAAYSAMYETPPLGRVKDSFEDACMHFQCAIEEAQRLGLAEDAARLSKRLAHVRAVYNSQFRGV
jgi:7,8-dihydro-6-hydroxymethylpterin-pyrophosphokinase